MIMIADRDLSQPYMYMSGVEPWTFCMQSTCSTIVLPLLFYLQCPALPLDNEIPQRYQISKSFQVPY